MSTHKRYTLTQLGWRPFFEIALSGIMRPGLVPGRIIMAEMNQYQVAGEFGERIAEVAGKVRHQAQTKSDLPAVGDWGALQLPENGPALIESVLPRQTSVTRLAAGSRKRVNSMGTEEQIIAANVDTIFIVTGLDRDYNPRRIERYLTLVYNSGATPVIILNKADLCDDVAVCETEIQNIALGVPVHAMNSTIASEVESLRRYFSTGLTVALLGSSGAGKSTIINSLLGYERQAVQQISQAVNKGRHTTTHRELILLPDGGLLMDNPGMREIQLSSNADDLSDSFTDIEALSESCRFNDCAHESEPGCAVQQALEDGELDTARLDSYLKLKRELHYQSERQRKSPNQVDKEKWKAIYTKAGHQFGKKSHKK